MAAHLVEEEKMMDAEAEAKRASRLRGMIVEQAQRATADSSLIECSTKDQEDMDPTWRLR